MPNLNLTNESEATEIAILKAASSYGLKPAWGYQAGIPGHPDYVLSDEQDAKYVAEAKVVRDGRTDRVIAQLSVAIIQSRHYANKILHSQPLAIVYVSNVVPTMLRGVRDFVDQYAADANVAIVTDEGASLFRLNGVWQQDSAMDSLMFEANERRFLGLSKASASPFNPFSDLNQWMLKVLLAREISPDLLKAPRDPIYSGADLARAADASAMSANRLIQYLKKERFLADGATGLTLGRREEFFNLWRSASMASPAEYKMRFRARVATTGQFAVLLKELGDKACLGLFAAADHLGMGHVSGVPPYIYMHKLPALGAKNPEWEKTSVCTQGQTPDFFVRRALAPISTFRGAVERDGQLCADVIQVWLDVVNHPSRGAEQAEHIYRTVLQPLVEAR